ncbi:MAG: glycosyltransferase family 4 protein, partial [Anaerolineae bacterium]
PSQETLDGMPVHRNFTLWEFMGIKGLRKLGGYLYILTLIGHLWRRRAEYDVIHVHGLHYHTFAAVLAGRWLKRPVLAKLANSGQASDVKKMQQDRQLALARLMLPTALKCDRFVALNKRVVEELTAVNVPPSHIIELPNGVETDAIPAKTNYALHEPARLIFVGRLHPQKGVDTLLHAMRQLIEHHNVALRLLGDGPLKDELEILAGQLGIASHVEFCGQTDQVLEHLQQADLFVLPSRAEGISNALLEAMTCGLPVIVSAIPGNVDVITHDQNGLRFTVDDPDSLAQNITSLLTQPHQRERLGRQARQTVERHYSLSSVADQYIALYQDLV